jgi:stress response protein YsnF
MLLQDCHSRVVIRERDSNVPVETTRAKKRAVDVGRIVSSADDNNAIPLDSAVELLEKRVDNATAPVVVSCVSGRSPSREIVDLVDQQN